MKLLKTRECPDCQGMAFQRSGREYFCPGCKLRFTPDWFPVHCVLFGLVGGLIAMGVVAFFVWLKYGGA